MWPTIALTPPLGAILRSLATGLARFLQPNRAIQNVSQCFPVLGLIAHPNLAGRAIPHTTAAAMLAVRSRKGPLPHTTKSALLALQQFKFDTVMFPINFVEYYTIGYGKAVLAEAKEQGAAVIAIKSMSYGRWPKDAERTRKWWYRTLEEPEMINLGLRFTLSQAPVVTAIPPAWQDLTDTAIEEIKTYQAATEQDLARCQKLAAGCQSVFQSVEQSTTNKVSRTGPHTPNNPDEFPPCMHA